MAKDRNKRDLMVFFFLLSFISVHCETKSCEMGFFCSVDWVMHCFGMIHIHVYKNIFFFLNFTFVSIFFIKPEVCGRGKGELGRKNLIAIRYGKVRNHTR